MIVITKGRYDFNEARATYRNSLLYSAGFIKITKGKVMKLTNTKYGIIENARGIHEFKVTRIEWRNVLAYALGFAILIMYVVNWFVL